MVPSLVYFENGVPSTYNGDLKNADNILGWITQELQQQIIKELNSDVLEAVQDQREFVAVIYYNKVCSILIHFMTILYSRWRQQMW